jgi:hypothetical protein
MFYTRCSRPTHPNQFFVEDALQKLNCNKKNAKHLFPDSTRETSHSNNSFIFSKVSPNESTLLTSVADPDPGSGIGCFLTPGSGMGKSQHPDPGSGMNNTDHIFLKLRNHFFAFFGVKILKFFDEDPRSGMETVRIRDPGW